MIEYNWREEASESFGPVTRPIAEVHIKDKNKIWRALNMYIDSGADVSIMPKSFGELFGHEMKKGRKIRLKGIDSEITAYIHKSENSLTQIKYYVYLRDFCVYISHQKSGALYEWNLFLFLSI